MTRIVLFLVTILLLSGCASQQPKMDPGPLGKPSSPAQAYRMIEQRTPVVAQQYQGKSYRLGANPDQSSQADCSHLVSAITRASLRGSGYAFKPYYLNTTGIRANSHEIALRETRPGDLLLFRPSKFSGQYAHVGVITRKEGKTIHFTHATSSKGVTETSTQSTTWKRYWSRYFDSFRRWNERVFAAAGPVDEVPDPASVDLSANACSAPDTGRERSRALCPDEPYEPWSLAAQN
jgi:hypothetical protein